VPATENELPFAMLRLLRLGSRLLLLQRPRKRVPNKARNRPVLAFRGALKRGSQIGIDRDGKLLASLLLVSHALYLKSSCAMMRRVRFAHNVPKRIRDF
jgi:hypothetical protein